MGELLDGADGVLVPGGFGNRGIEGKITAIRYAREHGLPYLGLCLGMQLAIVEYARNVAGYPDAHSIELDPETKHPVISLMPDQNGVEDIGGTLRLGSYPCVLAEDSLACRLYGTNRIEERHRHRYEVNNAYRDALTSHGMKLSGLSPDGRIVEMIELENHPFFIRDAGTSGIQVTPEPPASAVPRTDPGGCGLPQKRSGGRQKLTEGPKYVIRCGGRRLGIFRRLSPHRI